MKPMAIRTEFTFSINRDFIETITKSFVGGLFEKIDVNYGKLTGHNALRNCHVKYELSTTIQSASLKSIDIEYIQRAQLKHKNIFFARVAEVKNKISSVKIRTSVSFVDTISIQL